MWTDSETGKMAKARLSKGIWYVHGSETDGMFVPTDSLTVLGDCLLKIMKRMTLCFMETNGFLQ